MKKLTREEHVAAYWETPMKPYHEESAKIDLFGHEYTLVLCAFGDKYEDHRVMKGQFCVNDWLSDEEKFEVIRYLGELWPEVSRD